MSPKAFIIICAQLLLTKSIAGLQIGCGCGRGAAPVASGNRAFVVQSVSPITPSGLYVQSENQIEGALAVQGQLPFLGAVSLEGCAPDAGSSCVAYSCGDSNIGITQESGGAGAAGLRGCCSAY